MSAANIKKDDIEMSNEIATSFPVSNCNLCVCHHTAARMNEIILYYIFLKTKSVAVPL